MAARRSRWGRHGYGCQHVRAAGWLRQDSVARVTELLSACGLPLGAPKSLSTERLLSSCTSTKGAAGKLRLILLEAIGKGLVTADFDMEALNATSPPAAKLPEARWHDVDTVQLTPPKNT